MTAFDPFAADVQRDPYPHYARMHREAPVQRTARHAWIAVRHRDVAALLADERLAHWTIDAGAESQPANEFDRIVGRWLALMNPARRSRLRALTAPLFAPARLAALSHDIESEAERLLAHASPRFDLVRDYAEPLTMCAIAAQFGVPPAIREQFAERATAIRGSLFQVLTSGRARPEGQPFIDLLRTLFDDEEIRRGDGILASLVRAEDVDADDFVALALVFLFAGQENITNCIASGLWTLLRHPHALARLRRGEVPTETAIEELLRFESPVQYVSLHARECVALDGNIVQPGDEVLAAIGAANRDPEAFADPDRLDLSRSPNPHLSFGCGVLFCIGAALARLEARVAIDVLLSRFDRIDLAAEPSWRTVPAVLRGVASLPVTMTAEVTV
jgi:orsellenic acid P450 oxidase